SQYLGFRLSIPTRHVTLFPEFNATPAGHLRVPAAIRGEPEVSGPAAQATRGTPFADGCGRFRRCDGLPDLGLAAARGTRSRGREHERRHHDCEEHGHHVFGEIRFGEIRFGEIRFAGSRETGWYRQPVADAWRA